jgi:hypothetical protein
LKCGSLSLHPFAEARTIQLNSPFRCLNPPAAS